MIILCIFEGPLLTMVSFLPRQSNIIGTFLPEPCSLLFLEIIPRPMQSNDDGNYWGIGVARAPEDTAHIPPRTVFEAGPLDVNRYIARDWNKEFQTEMPHTLSRIFDKKYKALRKIADMQAHFIETALNLTRIVVSEVSSKYRTVRRLL